MVPSPYSDELSVQPKSLPCILPDTKIEIQICWHFWPKTNTKTANHKYIHYITGTKIQESNLVCTKYQSFSTFLPSFENGVMMLWQTVKNAGIDFVPLSHFSIQKLP